MKSLLIPTVTAFLWSCADRQSLKTATVKLVGVSAIVDITDSNLPVQAVPILKLFDCTNNEARCVFRISSISDKRQAPVYSSLLKNGTDTDKENKNSDPQFRDTKIVQFYASVKNTITSFYNSVDTTTSLGNSECIRSICREITFLSENRFEKAYAVIFSDLLEKSDLDFYREIPSQKSFEEFIVKKDLLPSLLATVTVIFVYRPPTREASLRYEKAVALFRSAIEVRGGKVIVEAQSNIFHL